MHTSFNRARLGILAAVLAASSAILLPATPAKAWYGPAWGWHGGDGWHHGWRGCCRDPVVSGAPRPVVVVKPPPIVVTQSRPVFAERPRPVFVEPPRVVYVPVAARPVFWIRPHWSGSYWIAGHWR